MRGLNGHVRQRFGVRPADWMVAGTARLLLSRGQVAAPYLLVACVCAVVTWPIWLQTDRLELGSDAALIHYPWFVLWRESLAGGTIPVWNPYVLSGLPALPTLQSGYGYPPHWLLSWLPAASAINVSAGLHVVLAGVGAAWCASRLRASAEGRVLAGLAYALGSALTARLWAGHLSFIEANAWLPVVTGCALSLRGPRTVVRLALVEGMLALAGQPEVLILSLWWLPIWTVGASIRWPVSKSGVRDVLRQLGMLVVGVALGGCLAAWQLLPTLALLGMSNRGQGMPWDFRTAASLPPWHVLGALAPTVFGDPRASGSAAYWPGPAWAWHERLLYVGIVPLVAAVCAPGRWRWVCGGAGVVALALAFGQYVPWYAWMDVVPGYASFRIPAKHLTLVALAVCLAAAAGLDRLRGRRVAAAAIGMGAVVAALGLTLPGWLPAVAAALGGNDLLPPTGAPSTTSLLAPSLALVAIGAAALLSGSWAARTLLVLGVLDVVLVLGPFRLTEGDPRQLASNLNAVREYSRMVVVGDAGPLDANLGPVMRIVQPAGYTSLFSAGYAELVSGSRDPGVVLGVTDTDTDTQVLWLLGYPGVLDLAQGELTVFSPPPPRVWVARCARAGGAAEVRAPDFPVQSCVTLAGADASASDVPPVGQAHITHEAPGWLDIEADGPGWLVTDQPWYPGWTAQVDGAGRAVEVLDGALVGVRLPTGSHTVRVRYSVPAGLWPGLALTVIAVLGLIGLCGWRPARARAWAHMIWRNG